MLKNNLIKGLCFLIFSFGARASMDSANVDVNVNVNEMVEMGGLTIPYLNISDNEVKGGVDVEATGSFCVYSNVYRDLGAPYPQFRLGATSANGNGSFISQNGNYQVEYTVLYGLGANPTGFNPLVEEGLPSLITMQNIPSSTCGNNLADNITLKIKISGYILPTVPAGSYSDYLMINITNF
tara:strand:+ start:1576 stop:2121 length:546 start_codon:yes stop_codon:yes gene_type:complete